MFVVVIDQCLVKNSGVSFGTFVSEREKGGESGTVGT